MSPAPPLGSWWTDYLQVPGYDPIATAGPSPLDPRAAEQALGFFTFHRFSGNVLRPS